MKEARGQQEFQNWRARQAFLPENRFFEANGKQLRPFCRFASRQTSAAPRLICSFTIASRLRPRLLLGLP
jgi:hypothetical protein